MVPYPYPTQFHPHLPNVHTVLGVQVALPRCVQAAVDPCKAAAVAGAAQLLTRCKAAQALLARHHNLGTLGDLGLHLPQGVGW